MSDEDLELAFNGLDGETGAPLVPELDAEAVAKALRGEKLDAADHARIAAALEGDRKDTLGTAEGVDDDDLAEAGWAVVFPAGGGAETAARRKRLKDLLALREDQAGEHYREYTYEPGWGAHEFLTKNKTGYDLANPSGGKVPYYVLLVGSPEEIPFYFQSQLDRMYAVGRLHFDEPEAYARYADAVEKAESSAVSRKKRALFWGTKNKADKSTALSHRYLAEPLAKETERAFGDWSVERALGDDATKQALLDATEDAPALLFTASHGVGFASGHARQAREQGALVCQDWPGPVLAAGQPITPAMLFAASDLAEANVAGAMAFLFACYGMGTPSRDTFAERVKAAATIAPSPFLSALPMALLGHAKGSALAVIAHVDRAWSTSFKWGGNRDQHEAIRSVVHALMKRRRVGAAMEYMGQRCMQLETAYKDERDAVDHGRDPRPEVEASLALGSKDAFRYALLGDPAVKLALR
ncbi:MAG: hypothetical protein R3B82_25890 [Sandaracinaceae bacterium]